MHVLTRRAPECSIILATGGRTAVLDRSLRSFGAQTIARDRFEIIVVDHSSTGDAGQLCEARARAMPLRYFAAKSAEAGRAKNIAIAAARAPIIVFATETETAHPDVLWQHLSGHSRDGRERTAVTGAASWSPELDMSPLMNHLSQHRVLAGPVPGPSGIMSYKTEFVRRHGLLDESLPALEELELYLRLTGEGLVVRSMQGAISHRHDSITLTEACEGAMLRGRSLVRIASSHPELSESARIPERLAYWRQVRWDMRRLFRRARRMEAELGAEEGVSQLVQPLFELYTSLLAGSEGRGINQEMRRRYPASADGLASAAGPQQEVPADRAVLSGRPIMAGQE
jgi:glycosyltransferase involved in cell wall biosynthesis